MIAKEIGDKRGEGVWLGNLGIAYYNSNKFSTAINYYEQALDILKPTLGPDHSLTKAFENNLRLAKSKLI